MAHVFLAGSALRLRVFPKPKLSQQRLKAGAAPPLSLELFPTPVDDEHDTPVMQMAAKIASLVLLNRYNAAILERAPELGLKDWWLTAGAIFQSVWNLRSGQPVDRHILDYDLFYFSEDLSWEAENEVIAAAAKLFSDLAVNVQPRNQARVHLWYPEKFGIAYPPLTTAAEGILRFPSSASTVGMKRSGEDFLDVYAPFGLGDLWNLIVRPNRALPLSKIYAEKTARWAAAWPSLTVFPWGDPEKDREKTSPP